LDCYEKALELEPNNSAMLMNRGVCLNNLNRRDEAIKSLQKALDFSTDDSNFFLIKHHLNIY